MAAGSPFCSERCALQYGVAVSQSSARRLLFQREMGVCQQCFFDAHRFFIELRALPTEQQRLQRLMNCPKKWPVRGARIDRIVAKPMEGDFWEADHIVPVAEGGGESDLSNFQTLCVPCHAEKTKQQVEAKEKRKRKEMAVGTADLRGFMVQEPANKGGAQAKARAEAKARAAAEAARAEAETAAEATRTAEAANAAAEAQAAVTLQAEGELASSLTPLMLVVGTTYAIARRNGAKEKATRDPDKMYLELPSEYKALSRNAVMTLKLRAASSSQGRHVVVTREEGRLLWIDGKSAGATTQLVADAYIELTDPDKDVAKRIAFSLRF